MPQIEIRPSWVFADEAGRHVDHQLFALLEAIHDTGKLTLAAERVGVSYRHAWNSLGKWAGFFGSALVVLEQGRGARLSALGEKLLWAQARARARLSPQLQNLASELNLEIERALAPPHPTLRMHASHGYAVAEIPDLVRADGRIGLDLQYLPAADALASLARGACDVAGFHVPEGSPGERALATYERWLDPRQHRLVHLVRRQQGLFVKPGNPARIASLRDLQRPGIRFINRQRGSGTRLLLDTLLAQGTIDPAAIDGYASEEFTHAAVAAYVASGMADVGMGVEPPARQFKLDFVPIAAERYFLLCREQTLGLAAVGVLLELLRSARFAERVARLPGYTAEQIGQIAQLGDAFPWLGRNSLKRRRAAAKPN
jgi:molybdate transport repressor ModE-like protein